MSASGAPQIEQPAMAARHCLSDLPYRALVYIRSSVHDVPLYQVAGSTHGPCGAKKALEEAFRVHGGICIYCRHPIASGEATIDHVEPRANGGSAALQNLVLAHKTCNQAKGSKAIEAFKPEAGREWLQALLSQIEDRLRRLDRA